MGTVDDAKQFSKVIVAVCTVIGMRRGPVPAPLLSLTYLVLSVSFSFNYKTQPFLTVVSDIGKCAFNMYFPDD